MASRHCCLLSAPLTRPRGWPPGQKPPRLLQAARAQSQARHPEAPNSIAAPLAHCYPSWVLAPQGRDKAQVLRSSPLCDLAPTCFSKLTLFPLACPPLLGISHLSSCQPYALPPEAFLFCPLADPRQPCSRLPVSEGLLHHYLSWRLARLGPIVRLDSELLEGQALSHIHPCGPRAWPGTQLPSPPGESFP